MFYNSRNVQKNLDGFDLLTCSGVDERLKVKGALPPRRAQLP